jgi:hypothetical protein
MSPPQNQADVLALARQVDGLFAAAFRVTHELGPAALAYVADVFDPAHRDQIGSASRAIAEACRRVANSGVPFHQRLGLAEYPTLVVAAVPFTSDGRVQAAFGVIFHCQDQGECDRRVGQLRSLAG